MDHTPTLVFFGGENDEGPSAGLYVLDLASLSGYRLDDGSGPGPRRDCALRYDAAMKTVTLYGGSVYYWEAQNELWQFSTMDNMWTFLDLGPESHEYDAPVGGVLLRSRLDGSVSLLVGESEGEHEETAFSWLGSTWAPYRQNVGLFE